MEKLKYKYLTLTLLLTEYVIWAYVHDRVLRPYFGDLLVAILLYTMVKSFVNTPKFKTAMAVLFVCYTVEISQHYHLIVHLGLQNSHIAHLLLGSYFSWIDMACYTIGITAVLVCEFMETGRFSRQLSA